VTDELKRNANLVEALGSALREGDHAVGTVPGLLKRVLEEGSWRKFVTQRGEEVEHARFADFVESAPLRGIGASIDLVRRIVANDVVVVDLLDEALRNPEGGSAAQRSTVANSNSGRKDGTTRAYALRRLRKDKPDLHAEVLAGRISAHAAMVQAGFRPKTITIRLTSVESVVNSLRSGIPEEMLSEVASRLR